MAIYDEKDSENTRVKPRLLVYACANTGKMKNAGGYT